MQDRKPVEKVVGKARMSWYLQKEVKEKIRGIIKRAGGTIDETNVIHGCDIYSSMFTKMLELGALVTYCDATGRLMISNWGSLGLVIHRRK